MTSSFWADIVALLDAQQAVSLAMVAGHSRHSPGTRGAKLCVTDDDVFGTIGGGVMEHTITTERREALNETDGGFHTEVLAHRESGNAKRSGLFCAGEQRMVYAVVCPNSRAHSVLREAAERFEGDRGGMIWLGDDGWEIVDTLWDRTSPPIAFEKGSYRELLFNPFRVAIVGGGHCGRALSQTMAQLGYHVTLIDPRKEEQTFVDNPWPDRKLTTSYAEAAAAVTRPELTHLVVMTANFPTDVEALLGVGELPFPYIGVMGSPAKLARIRESVPAALIQRLHAPIGIPMSSDTPDEIAISIASQILQLRETLFGWTHPDV